MGRPLNKKYFAANANNNIKVQFNNGLDSVAGYITTQKGTKKFKVKEFDDSTTYICRLVPKASGDLLSGEMSITVKNDAGTISQISKISAHRVTTGGISYPWNFSTSTSDGAVQIEEAGTNTAGAGATDLEGDDITLIPASSLTAQGGLIAHFSPTVYFFTQGQANALYAANPSIFYVIGSNGVQTKYDGITLGAVTASGPYWGITTSGGTITVGTYLSGAANSNVYY